MDIYRIRKVYFVSFGYVIRVLWRLSAVSSRFIIFSLIWAVMGGAFEVIIDGMMIVLWYVIIAGYFCKEFGMRTVWFRFKRVFARMFCDDDNCNAFRSLLRLCCCGVGLVMPVLLIIGFTIPLGIMYCKDRFVYMIRMIENVTILAVITWFAYDKSIVCSFCAVLLYLCLFLIHFDI